ncbi:hypothetical protein B0H17DRAFT_1123769 [Mycena rosella]|uniref:Uncharacterized protein n=1 Tax=Mycena rosella TaxID=1033263 RepID=A0AAD7H2Z3_MYCRO|nr:hypothetical protein B0H17DRAFT_1123769 [Mycena rosella]
MCPRGLRPQASKRVGASSSTQHACGNRVPLKTVPSRSGMAEKPLSRGGKQGDTTQDEQLTWPGADNADEMGLQSVSDPEAEDVGVDADDVSSITRGANLLKVDAEEDSVVLLTPLSSVHFDIGGAPPTTGKGAVAYPEVGGDDSFVDAGSKVEIEDDWVDFVASPSPAPSKKMFASKGKGRRRCRCPAIRTLGVNGVPTAKFGPPHADTFWD